MFKLLLKGINSIIENTNPHRKYIYDVYERRGKENYE